MDIVGRINRARVPRVPRVSHAMKQRLYQSLIHWMFASWLMGAMFVCIETFHQNAGWQPHPEDHVSSIIAKLVAESGLPVPRFPLLPLLLQTVVYVRLTEVPQPSYMRCLDITRPAPVFLHWADRHFHFYSAVATSALTWRLIRGLWYLTAVFVKSEYEYVMQLQGQAIPTTRLISELVVAGSLLNQLFCAYGMAHIWASQLLQFEVVDAKRILAVFVLTNLAWARYEWDE